MFFREIYIYKSILHLLVRDLLHALEEVDTLKNMYGEFPDHHAIEFREVMRVLCQLIIIDLALILSLLFDFSLLSLVITEYITWHWSSIGRN